MTNEEIVLLIREGTDVQKNMQTLYEQNRNLILKIITPYEKLTGCDKDDLMQESYLALVDAVERYEPESDAQFSSYFVYWIKQKCSRYMKSTGHTKRVPEYISIRISKYKKFTGQFFQTYKTEPSDHAICTELAINQKQLNHLRKTMEELNCISMDAMMPDTDGLTVGDSIPSDGDLETDVITRLDREKEKEVLWSIVDELEENQSKMVRGCYQYQKTLKELAEEFNISVQSARTVKSDALNILGRKKEVKRIAEDNGYYNCSQAYKGSVGAFKRNRMSCVESIAFKHLENLERAKNIEEEMKELMSVYGTKSE